MPGTTVFIDTIYTNDSKCKSKLDKKLRESMCWTEKVTRWWSTCCALLRTSVWIHSTSVNAGQVWKLASNPRVHFPGAIWLDQVAESLSSGFKRAALPQYIRWRAMESYWRTHLSSDANRSSTHAHTHMYTNAHTEKDPNTFPFTLWLCKRKMVTICPLLVFLNHLRNQLFQISQCAGQPAKSKILQRHLAKNIKLI